MVKKRKYVLKKPRKKLRKPRRIASKKVYKRRVLRSKYGEFLGSRKAR